MILDRVKGVTTVRHDGRVSVTTQYTKTLGSVTTDKVVRHDGRKSSIVILTGGYVLPLCVMTEGSVRHDGLYKNSMVRHDGGVCVMTD